MDIGERYRRLTFWNKFGVISGIASILSLFLTILAIYQSTIMRFPQHPEDYRSRQPLRSLLLLDNLGFFLLTILVCFVVLAVWLRVWTKFVARSNTPSGIQQPLAGSLRFLWGFMGSYSLVLPLFLFLTPIVGQDFNRSSAEDWFGNVLGATIHAGLAGVLSIFYPSTDRIRSAVFGGLAYLPVA